MTFDNVNKKTGLRRILSAFINTGKGFVWMIRHEAAFQQELLLATMLSVLSFFLDVSSLERGVLICSLLFVLLIETINTAVEAVVDRIGLEIHPLSGLAKDLGSAAVFISFLIAVVIWASVLL